MQKIPQNSSATESGAVFTGFLSGIFRNNQGTITSSEPVCRMACSVESGSPLSVMMVSGTLLDEVRKATSIPENIPLFTLQGGLNRDKLKGMDNLIIRMLTKGLSEQKQRTEQEERMLELLQSDASFVCEENLSGVLDWFDTLPE